MKENLIQVHVHSFKESYTFVFIVHESYTPEDRQLEREFYAAASPVGVHFEAEIKNFSEFATEDHWSKVQHHTSNKTGKHYVSWTDHVQTRLELETMLRMWCIGSVYTLEQGIQCEDVLKENNIAKNDFDAARQCFYLLGIHIKHTETANKQFEERLHIHFAPTNN